MVFPQGFPQSGLDPVSGKTQAEESRNFSLHNSYYVTSQIPGKSSLFWCDNRQRC